MRVPIVDDEPLARRGVCARLRTFSDVEIVGECADGASAVESILSLEPDLVFLDVQMPEIDGFDVIRLCKPTACPPLSFSPRTRNTPCELFEVHALDYLLKPLDDERFSVAVNRARKQLDTTREAELVGRMLRSLDQNSGSYASRFVIRVGSRIQIVSADDLEWIAAAGDYSELHTANATHLLRETMTSLEQKLDPGKFARIHPS